MQITVRCFARVRELLGRDVVDVEVPVGTTVGGLKTTLAQQAPELDRLPLACAVNREWADGERELQAGDEVAFIPPISGGAPPRRAAFALVEGPLDARALEEEVRTDADGAVVTFQGVTRDHHHGRAVRHLAYEAYAEMAQQAMAAIFEDALARFDVTCVRATHRLGTVPVGEASVVVVVAAPHRAAAFDACRYLMDRLKADVPIFKRETLADGEARWVGDLPVDRPKV